MPKLTFPKRHTHRDVRSREPLTPPEVDKLRKAAQSRTPSPRLSCLDTTAMPRRVSGAGGPSACAGGEASHFNHPLGIPGHFPQMSVRILEGARVPAPKGVMRWLDHDSPGPCGLG